jgi:hypothetical protein
VTQVSLDELHNLWHLNASESRRMMTPHEINSFNFFFVSILQMKYNVFLHSTFKRQFELIFLAKQHIHITHNYHVVCYFSLIFLMGQIIDYILLLEIEKKILIFFCVTDTFEFYFKNETMKNFVGTQHIKVELIF